MAPSQGAPSTPLPTSPSERPLPEERAVLLRTLRVELLTTAQQRERAQALLDARHYLGGVQAVGEQLHYAVTDAHGTWVISAETGGRISLPLSYRSREPSRLNIVPPGLLAANSCPAAGSNCGFLNAWPVFVQ